MAWLDGLLDGFDPNNPRGMQMAGLLGGLNALGAGLSAAGAPRAVGQPGPSMADAFGAFGQGQQRGLMGAFQNAQLQRQQSRAALLAEAQSSRPDDQISPQARAMRSALSTLPENVRALADPDQLPQLTVQRETQRQRPMTAAELQAAGYRPGTVAYTSDWTGAANVAQAPDYKSPEAEAQAIRIAGASRAAPLPVEVNGKLVDPRTGRVVYDGGGGQPLSPANAWNEILRYAPLVAQGQIAPDSPEGQRYLAAQTILTQPRPVQITQPDGSVMQVMQSPEFPFPRLQGQGQGAQQPAPAAGGALPQPTPAVAAQGTVIKPPPPLTESQGNATMYLQRMQEAEKRLSGIVAKGYTPGNLMDAAASRAGIAGNYTLSDNAQGYKQAQEDWVRAKLRKESGAVIAKDEMEAEIKTYFPQPGDSTSTIQQKAAARETAMRALSAATGRGMDRIQAEPPPPPRPAPPPPPGFQVIPR